MAVVQVKKQRKSSSTEEACNAMNRQPLVLLLAFFCVGIFVADAFPAFTRGAYLAIFIGLIIVVISFIKQLIFIQLRRIALCLFFLSAGFFSFHFNSETSEVPKLGKQEKLIFELKKKLKPSEKHLRYEIEIMGSPSHKHLDGFPVRSVVSIPKGVLELDFKHDYSANAFINPIKPREHPYQFDYKKYLSRKGIHFQAYVSGDILKKERSSLGIADKIKQKHLEALQTITDSSLKDKSKAFLKGIILADRTGIDLGTLEDFNRSGLMHLLAISGAHMAVIFFVVLLLLKPFFSVKWKRVPIYLSLVFIWSFSIFIDYGNSVVRSCIMITVYYASILLQRKTNLLHAIALAGFGILLFDPLQIFDVGFQLSFVAVLGIYWLHPFILGWFPKNNSRFLSFFLNVFSITLSCQIATLPLVLYYFHQYSLVSIFANLVVFP